VNTPILVGQVSPRKQHRLHAVQTADGLTFAACRSGRGRILGGTQRPVTGDNADRVCRHRRCRTLLAQQIADASQVATAAEGNAYRDEPVQNLAALAEALLTPAQRLDRARRHAAMVAEIRARLLANGSLVDRMRATAQLAPAVQARPEPARRRTWADLRDQFADAHTRQLALTAAA
jgi:hypothetical protein